MIDTTLSEGLFHPAHDPRPIFLKCLSSHEQTEMTGWRDIVAEIRRRRSYQPFHSKQLFGGNHFVGESGKKIQWDPQAREIDPLPQGYEASAGKLVVLIQFLDDFEIVISWIINGPGIPLPEDGFELQSFAILRPTTRPLLA